jgi:hypothetical protein
VSYEWYDVVGNVGVCMILGCYLLLQLDRLESSGLTFSILNGIGALLILISLAYEFNKSAFIVELFWLLISLFGIVRYLMSKRGVT